MSSDTFSELLRACGRLPPEPPDAQAGAAGQGSDEGPQAEEFSLLITLLHGSSRQCAQGVGRQRRPVLLVPLDAPARFRLGHHQAFELEPGDVLAADDLFLATDSPECEARLVAVSFLPDFVFSLGSPSHDYTFLLPFASSPARRPRILDARDPAARAVHGALARLVDCYAARGPFYRAGCKAFLVEVLYQLVVHLRASELLAWEFVRQQERSHRLKKLFDHIAAHPADHLSVRDAAAMVEMGTPQFMKAFKRVAGMTLVAYLNHVRLTNGARLLHDTTRSIADVADAVGFADQSYFDRRFKRAFGQSPREFRQALAGRGRTIRTPG